MFTRGRKRLQSRYVCDNKNTRYSLYQQALALHGGTRKIRIPSKTRVAGSMLLMQDFICSYKALQYYGIKCAAFNGLLPSPQECQQMAEFVAIMDQAFRLAFQSQGDRPEVACEMTLLLSFVKAYYEETTVFKVVDLTQEWSATTAYKDLPKRKMTTDAAKHMQLPVMTNASIKLIGRLDNAYEEYFSEPNVYRLGAMAIHPLLGGEGFEILEELRSPTERNCSKQRRLSS